MDPQMVLWFALARLAKVWDLYTEAIGVPYALSDGALLGAVRHGNTMQPGFLGNPPNSTKWGRHGNGAVPKGGCNYSGTKGTGECVDCQGVPCTPPLRRSISGFLAVCPVYEVQ